MTQKIRYKVFKANKGGNNYSIEYGLERDINKWLGENDGKIVVLETVPMMFPIEGKGRLASISSGLFEAGVIVRYEVLEETHLR